METITVKKRSKNFSPKETAVLVQEVEKRRGVLFGPLKGPTLTQHHRNSAWHQVAKAVNAVAPVFRSAVELKKKFSDLKSRKKLKAFAATCMDKGTGGGENEGNTPLSAVESILTQFIGTETWNNMEGIVVGVDALQQSATTMPSTNTAPIKEEPFQELITDAPPTSTAAIEEVTVDSGNVSIILLPSCSPSPPHTATFETEINSSIPKSGPVPADPLVLERDAKRPSTVVPKEVQKTPQEETNLLLRELVGEFRSFKDEFLKIKKLELELLNQLWKSSGET